MATVKGDVHDIGKNIVGVVLQCNNYTVIDLGVMVPAQKILDAAKEHGADIIGLSGLITPSLDEMVNFAAEMQRQGLEIPLLIGGATTSRAHTAVKVAPQVRRGRSCGSRTHRVPCPSRRRCSTTSQRAALLEAPRPTTPACESGTRRRTTGRWLTLEKARANRTPIDWEGYVPPRPQQPGVRVFTDYDIAELREYIDWQPFFNAWEMKGKFPDILNNPAPGEAARKLYEDGQDMLDRLIKEKWLTANGVFGFFPANAVGDDIEVYADEARTRCARCSATCASRASTARASRTARSATSSPPRSTGLADYVGAFAVTAGLGSQDRIPEFKDGARRLQRDPAGVARGPPRGVVRRADARAGPQASSGATSPTRTSATRP